MLNCDNDICNILALHCKPTSKLLTYAAASLCSLQAHFQPPRLTLGSWINLPIGPRSTVVLTTTYLSETVRLGKGSRGSLFAFVKEQSAQDAGERGFRSRLRGRVSKIWLMMICMQRSRARQPQLAGLWLWRSWQVSVQLLLPCGGPQGLGRLPPLSPLSLQLSLPRLE